MKDPRESCDFCVTKDGEPRRRPAEYTCSRCGKRGCEKHKNLVLDTKECMVVT
jgi:hypothetical protein